VPDTERSDTITRGGRLEAAHEAGIAPLVAACLVATLAFCAYTQTLLPGVDLGDTGGFQASVLWPEPSARRAYPLYFALAKPFTQALAAANPARGLNLFSAVWAGVAAGLLTFFVARLTAFTIAGIVSGLLLAFSHTFWTQAIIAEVYSLHLTLVGACLIALYWWSLAPTTGRLAVFFAVYALAFGNHLTMILLFIPCTVFLFHAHPRRRELVRPSTIALAIGIAAVGALQYVQNFLWVWSSIEAPVSWSDRIAAFWMDATKSDWRGEMVMGVDRSQVIDRLAMVRWDAWQQFGWIGLALAVIGATRVWRLSREWAAFLWLAYVISTVFAWTYNVGDTHVFLLPSHFFTALLAGIAVAPLPPRATLPTRTLVPFAAAAMLAVLYAGWRGWETWPVVDRHSDRRAEAFVARVTRDIDEKSALLVSKMNWQLENAVLYSGRFVQRGLAWVPLADVLPHFPFLVGDNLAEDRDIVLTAQAAADVRSTYGDAFSIVQDLPGAPTLVSLATQVPRGAPYVMTWLAPPPDEATIDPRDLNAAVAVLAKGLPPAVVNVGYEVWGGTAGEKPAFHRASTRPFIDSFSIAGDRYTVRMDSWLPEDTFRREGFGHVLRGREHLMWIERGISLMWLSQSGIPAQIYAGGLYAPEARFRIPAPSARLARSDVGRVQ
jgi:transmembrane protein TMEM260 (protein O-mannosyltransferase)